MADSENSSGSGSDPYATSKANLRESIKWLAGIFSALAALVIAGTPISGLGSPSLDIPHVIIGTVTIVLCFGCICTSVVLMLRLLRADLTYPSDIDPSIKLTTRANAKELLAIREDIARHKDDFIPQYDDYSAFLRTIENANETALELAQK